MFVCDLSQEIKCLKAANHESLHCRYVCLSRPYIRVPGVCLREEGGNGDGGVFRSECSRLGEVRQVRFTSDRILDVPSEEGLRPAAFSHARRSFTCQVRRYKCTLIANFEIQSVSSTNGREVGMAGRERHLGEFARSLGWREAIPRLQRVETPSPCSIPLLMTCRAQAILGYLHGYLGKFVSTWHRRTSPTADSRFGYTEDYPNVCFWSGMVVG